MKTTENNIHLTSPLKVRVFDLDSSEIPQWEGTVERLGENCAVVQSKSTTKDFNLNPPQTVHRVEFWSKNELYGVVNGRMYATERSPWIEIRPGQGGDKISFEAMLTRYRKEQHIDLCRNSPVESKTTPTGFEHFSFIPLTVPELNLEDVDTATTFLDRKFSYPILVTGMTGGVESATLINKRIALACQKFQIPMGLGSQRLIDQDPKYASIFDVKKHAPNLFLIGNIGMAQVCSGWSTDRIKRLVDSVNADAIAIHINVLQELVQVEGDRHFKNFFVELERICRDLETPVIVKEVGCGVDQRTFSRLVECGVSAVDVGGTGGTSWARIEGLRTTNPVSSALSETFSDWGIPTAFNLKALSGRQLSTPITATGGIRDGLMVAKAVALGAKMVGIGLPIFKAAISDDALAVEQKLAEFCEGLKMTCLLTGAKHHSELDKKLVVGKPYENYLRDLETQKSTF